MHCGNEPEERQEELHSAQQIHLVFLHTPTVQVVISINRLVDIELAHSENLEEDQFVLHEHGAEETVPVRGDS